MKKILFSLFFLSLTLLIAAQTESELKDKIISPEFDASKAPWAGADVKTIDQYLKKVVEYPEDARSLKLMGTCVIEFVVTPRGRVRDLNVINSVSSSIDRAMISAINDTDGMWKPGSVNGSPAHMKKEVSLVFVPGPEIDLVAEARKQLELGNAALFTDQNPKKALEHLDRAVLMLPYDKNLLSLRSYCKYELGDKKGARKDWERVVNMDIGETAQLETGYLIIKMKDLDGYEDYNKAVNKKRQ